MAFTNGSRGNGRLPMINFRLVLSALLSLSLLAGPMVLVSCGGSDPEPEPERTSSKRKKRSSSSKKSSSSRKKSSSSKRSSSSKSSSRRGSSDLEDEVAALLGEARSSGASTAFASAYRKAKKYYDDARNMDDESRAEARYKRAKSGLAELLEEYEDLKKKKGELDKLAKEAEEAKTAAEEAGAEKLAPDDYKDAVDLLAEAKEAASEASSASDVKQVADDYKTAAELFADAIDLAKRNAAQSERAQAELTAMQRYKDQAKQQGADVKAITDWAQAERSERQATADLDAGRFQAAINSYQQATQSYIRALQSTVSAEKMAELVKKNQAETKAFLEQQRLLEEKRIAADKETELAKAKAKQLALEAQRRAAQGGSGVVPLGSGGNIGGGFNEQFASQNLSAAANYLNASLYRQELDEEDEEFLNEHYKKLASTLQYDPETGVAFMDLRSGANMRKDFKDMVGSLHRKKYISFINTFIEGSEEAQSFMGNTRGTFLLPIPFKYRAKVEWDMSIQTMDSNGTFNVIMMYDKRKSHYLTNWIHWQSSTRGATPKTVRAVPGKYSGSANYWFDKTRDIGMVVEFNAPGVDLGTDEPTEEQLTDNAKMTVIYDTKTDPIENTFTSSGPITTGGYIGFKWNRVKFTVKRLKISGILDKEAAVAQLRKITRIKKKGPSRKKAPAKPTQKVSPSDLLNPGGGKGGQPDFDF